MAVFHIDITNGVIQWDRNDADRTPNPTQYFAAIGKEKPTPIKVRGWPFDKMFLTHGSEENGHAVAWRKK